MERMVLQALQAKYGYNEPIFLSEISFENISNNYLRQIFKRLTDEGSLQRYDAGIYYLPKKSTMLKNSYLDSNKVIINKYITRGKEVYGYFTGFTFANQIGLTTQVPVRKEVVSNKESSQGRTLKFGGSTIRVKKPRILITNKNYKVLQLLDLINDFEKWAEYEVDEVYKIIARYVTEEQIGRDVIQEYLPYYPAKVAKRLIGSGLIYVFA